MISLSFLTDFSSSWWLWWILPFVLGVFLSYVVMKKWRTMFNDLEQENRKLKTKFGNIDDDATQYQKEIKDLKGQIAIQRGRIRELENK